MNKKIFLIFFAIFTLESSEFNIDAILEESSKETAIKKVKLKKLVKDSTESASKAQEDFYYKHQYHPEPNLSTSEQHSKDMKTSCLAQTKYGSTHCYGIKDQDMKTSCLAQTEYGSTHCYGITDEDIKTSCLSQTEYGETHCYGIKDEDIKTSCLAQTKYGETYCYGIKDQDMKNSCIAQAKHDEMYCYSIGQ
jgi:hypothetical protein